MRDLGVSLLRIAVTVLLLLCPSAAEPPARPPALVLQGGHWAPAHSAAFSPDGSVVASAGADNTVALWDVATGHLLASLEGHNSYVYAVAFHPDGRTLASGANDGTVRLWEVETGRCQRKLEMGGAVRRLAFSPDGKLLATGSEDHSACLWDVASGKRLSRLDHPEPVAGLAFSSDGSRLATGCGSQQIRLWQVKSPTTPPRLLQLDRGHTLMDLALHPDGKILATSSWDGCVRLWDLQSGSVVRTLEGLRNPGGEGGQVAAVAFAPDGSQLAAGAEDGSIHLWPWPVTGAPRVMKAHSMGVTALAFSRDGRLLASGGMRPALALWSPRTGREVRSFQSPTRSADAVAFDDRTLVTAGGWGALEEWDLSSGVLGRSRSSDDGAAMSLARSRDGSLTLMGFADSMAVVWRRDAPRLTLRGHDKPVVAVALRQDGRLAATASWDGTARLWSLPDGQLLATLRHGKDLTSVVFTSSGEVATGSEDGTVRLWEASTGRQTRRWEVGAPVTALAVTSQGLLAGMQDGRICALQSSDTRPWEVGHTGRVSGVAVSPDGAVAVSASWDRTVIVWEVKTGRILRRLEGHTWRVNGVAFHPSGKVAASVSDDGSIRLWGVQSGQPLATALAMSGDWLAVTPDGFFDGSPGGMRKVRWRLSPRLRDTAEPEQYFQEFYHPGLLADVIEQALTIPEILRRRNDPRASMTVISKDRRLPRLSLEVTRGQVGVRIHPPVPAHDVRLFRDGVLVARWAGARPAGLLTARVPLTAGPNQLMAYAFNDSDVKSLDAVATVEGPADQARPAHAWILAIGINRYRDAGNNLAYAVPDAKALAEGLRQRLPFPAERIGVRFLLDRQATRSGILLALEQLTRQAAPEDTVIISYAGHGTRQAGKFFLMPHDGSLSKGNVSEADLEKALLPLQSRNLLLILDACYSGQVLENREWRRGPLNARGLGQLAWEKGMDVLTACQSRESALEAVQFGHGLLTYALDEGLKSAPRQRGILMARSWLDFAAAQVPRLLQGGPAQQTPRVFYRRQGGGSWPVAR